MLSFSGIRCVPAGGQVPVQREHPWRHPHRDSLTAGGWELIQPTFNLDDCSGVGCCWLGGGVEGLGPIWPSARSNTIPREERGAEVKFVILFFVNSILLQTELHPTFPEFCRWRRWGVHRWGHFGEIWKETSSFFQETIRGDLSGGEWEARTASGNFQTSFRFDFKERLFISACLSWSLAQWKKKKCWIHPQDSSWWWQRTKNLPDAHIWTGEWDWINNFWPVIWNRKRYLGTLKNEKKC